MIKKLRGFSRTHSAKRFPLEGFPENLRAAKNLDAENVRELSTGLHLPPATVRGVRSFYDNLHTPPHGVRVCQGTSCALANSSAVYETLSENVPCTKAYCLGFCDRSPAVLRSNGTIAVDCTPDDILRTIDDNDRVAPQPDIRCAADRAIVTERIAKGSFASLSTAREAGVYEALTYALQHESGNVLDEVERSGERGRGGAAFPTGAKWRSCARTPNKTKYVIANGDEGDPGSFIDRVLMEMDPHAILEGMALCGYAAGAQEGIVFVRSEYPQASKTMRNAIDEATREGILGPRVLDTDFSFNVRVFVAMGSYVCGEETAMLNAIEGFRGEVRLRPPYPAEAGLFGCPTIVDNVETLVNIPWIIREGAEAYRAMGTAGSPGTKAFCLNHGFAKPGIVEVPFGTRLRTVIEECGGNGRANRPIEAVVLGGPMGSIVFPSDWDTPVCYDAMTASDLRLGHAGLVALQSPVDWDSLLRHWLTFMQDESCGKCVPCRVGSQRALDAACAPPNTERSDILARLCAIMEEGSLCAFGKSTPGAIRTILHALGNPS